MKETQIDRDIDRQILESQIDKQRHRQIDRDKDRYKHRQIETDIDINRQRHRQIETQIDRTIDRQRHRQKETKTLYINISIRICPAQKNCLGDKPKETIDNNINIYKHRQIEPQLDRDTDRKKHEQI